MRNRIQWLNMVVQDKQDDMWDENTTGGRCWWVVDVDMKTGVAYTYVNAVCDSTTEHCYRYLGLTADELPKST